MLGAPGAEGALERADHRADLGRGQVDVAALAPRSHLQPAHRVILSRGPDRGIIGPSHRIKVAHAEIQSVPKSQDQYGSGMPRTTRPVELALAVTDGSAPLRHRIADAVVAELRTGRLRPGDALPSTRSLASALGLSRGPVVAAYDELVAAGFVVSRAGSGAVVAPGPTGPPPPGPSPTCPRRTVSGPASGTRRRRRRAGTCAPAARTPPCSTPPRGGARGGLPGRPSRATMPGPGPPTSACATCSPSTCAAAVGSPWRPTTS